MTEALFIYDIFENIINYLDPISISNLTSTCKGTSNIYYSNIKHINKKMVNKIFNYFNLWKITELQQNHLTKQKNFNSFINNLDLYELKYLKQQSCNIYKYFYNHPESNIGDFLIYHIEHTYPYEPNDFFKYLISLCDKRIYYQPNCEQIKNINDKINVLKYRLSTNDILYILTYCNLAHFSILLDHFHIKSNLISYIIKEMLLASKKQINNNLIDTNEKIYKSLDYFFYKHVFGRQNFNLFLNHIIVTFLEQHQNDFINFIFIKRRRYRPNEIELNYQSLIVAGIESNNFLGLQTVWSEYNRENESEYGNENDDHIQIFENFILIITPETITKICKNGWFSMLKWVVENLLQSTINLSGYITAIRDGIFLYEISINQGNLNKNQNRNFEELLFLKNYLTKQNKDIINNEIDIIYKSNRALHNKKFIQL